MPPQTTKQQFQLMLQNLLVERFKIKLHHKTEPFPVMSLLSRRADRNSFRQRTQTLPMLRLDSQVSLMKTVFPFCRLAMDK